MLGIPAFPLDTLKGWWKRRCSPASPRMDSAFKPPHRLSLKLQQKWSHQWGTDLFSVPHTSTGPTNTDSCSCPALSLLKAKEGSKTLKLVFSCYSDASPFPSNHLIQSFTVHIISQRPNISLERDTFWSSEAFRDLGTQVNWEERNCSFTTYIVSANQWLHAPGLLFQPTKPAMLAKHYAMFLKKKKSI